MIIPQITNLKLRISLVRYSQSFGILSLIFCVISLGLVSISNSVAWIFFAGSLFLMILSLIYSLYEIHLSIKALEIEIESILKSNF
ncbi:PF11026 family protein [Leptospira fainei serovar Hurstbridge str. BUT 6]|uniref:PF11026 family protein n=1 Tax=Leptospira fainei serovar Hurstbridge str. BUT 6 TaxID=1193011 RepID=S3UV70_9LEPT|nr:PF11026 family protein [Leptospira fainei serovar Hurstbridge str. BUT 6]